MTDRPVIVFAFWGRRANVELQIPFIRRILDEHKNVRFHGWNMARERIDAAYLHTVTDVEVCHRLYNPQSWRHLERVWRYYLQPRFKDHLFVKLDDDVVFMETDRFGEFVDAIGADMVLSAMTVNNGACTPLRDELWKGFEALSIDLLDVHMSNAYAQMAHTWMFDNWRDMVGQPAKLIDTDDWLSINAIGFDWHTGRRICGHIGKPSPRWIAGREWHHRARVGDEGAVNLLPRKVMQGFTVAHLGFGPQHLTDDQETLWRKQYIKIGQEYLHESRRDTAVQGPRHRPVAQGQPRARSRTLGPGVVDLH